LTDDTQNLKTLWRLAHVLALHELCEPLGSKGVCVCILTHYRAQSYE
jgi:hypothetical protein